MRRLGFTALLGILALTTAAAAARSGEPYPCGPDASPGPYAKQPAATPATRFVIDGDLYAIVTSAGGGLIGGWSGPPVLSFEGAYGWTKAMGVKANILSAAEIPGATFGDGGSRSEFTFECTGAYRARAVVRNGRDPVAFSLFDDRGGTVTRAFHTPPLRLPLRAVVELRFTHPPGPRPPTLLIDDHADRRWDRRLTLRRGAGGLAP
jgi:hypothetical protein